MNFWNCRLKINAAANQAFVWNSMELINMYRVSKMYIGIENIKFHRSTVTILWKSHKINFIGMQHIKLEAHFEYKLPNLWFAEIERIYKYRKLWAGTIITCNKIWIDSIFSVHNFHKTILKRFDILNSNNMHTRTQLLISLRADVKKVLRSPKRTQINRICFQMKDISPDFCSKKTYEKIFFAEFPGTRVEMWPFILWVLDLAENIISLGFTNNANRSLIWPFEVLLLLLLLLVVAIWWMLLPVQSQIFALNKDIYSFFDMFCRLISVIVCIFIVKDILIVDNNENDLCELGAADLIAKFNNAQHKLQGANHWETNWIFL